MSTKDKLGQSQLITIDEETESTRVPESKSVVQDAKPWDNSEEILKLVQDGAVKVKNLFGIMTPMDTIKALAEELKSLNPQILLNREVIMKSLSFLDIKYRNPKQLILDDFIITPEKIKALKDKGLIVYTEAKVAEIIEEYSSSLVELLKTKIDYLERKVEMEKLKNKHIPTIRGEQALSYLNKTVHELMEINMTLTEQTDMKDRIIRRLEEKLERHNLLKNEINGEAETNKKPTQETAAV